MDLRQNVVWNPKSDLYPSDVGYGERGGCWRYQATQIYVPTQNVPGEGSFQIGIQNNQIRLPQCRTRVLESGFSGAESFLRLVIVRLGEALPRIQGLSALEVQVGTGMLRQGSIHLGSRLLHLILDIFLAN